MADRDFEIRTFDDLSGEMVSEIQQQQEGLEGRKKLTDFSQGSVIMTLVRAVAAVVARAWIFLEELTEGFYVSTATGDRLKRRLRDFGFEMLPGSRATGAVLVVRQAGDSFTGSIRPGDVLSRGDLVFTVIGGSQEFGPVSSDSVVRAVTVQANENGVLANLPANTQLQSADTRYRGLTFIVGTSIDQAKVNATSGGFSGGIDDETDDQARTRFQSYIKNIGKGTIDVIENAVKQVSGVRTAKVWDNSRLNSSTNLREGPRSPSVEEPEGFPGYPGYIVVQVQPVVVEPSGNLTPTMLTAVSQVIEANKAAGVAYQIQTVSAVVIDVVVRIGTAIDTQSADWTNYTARLQTTLQNAFNLLNVNDPLYTGALAGDLLAVDRAKAPGGIQLDCTYGDGPDAGDPAANEFGKISVDTTGDGEILVLGNVTFEAESL